MVNCSNCGNQLPEPVPPYCPNCGNSTNPINPSLQPSKKKGNIIWYGIIILVIILFVGFARSREALTIENAIVVPTDVSKIDYPSAFNNPTITSVQVFDPYCAIEREEIAYPVEYLGDYEFPQVNGAPLPAEISRVVGLHDVGIPDYTFMDCANNVTNDARALEREGFLKAMKRAQSLGADEITITNMLKFSDFENAELEPLERCPVSSDDFCYIAGNAEELGLDTTLCLNLFIIDKNPWDYPIPSSDWLATLIHNWETFVLNQAQLSEETGVDALMINHFDWQPYIKGYEDVYQTGMLALLGKVRTVYHGRILFMLDPLQGADLDKLSKLLSSVDGFIVNAVPAPLSYASDKTVSVSNLKGLYLTYFRNIAIEFNKFHKPYLIRVLIQSEKTFLENGWNEDMSCVRKGDDPCYQLHLEVDFSVQAIAYEAMLEAIAQVHTEQQMDVYGVETTGYLFMDVVLPHVSHPQISQSVRDKPAEAVIYQWFKR